MYDETNVPSPEYLVRPVVRYVITRFCHGFTSKDGRIGTSGSSEVVAEVPNEDRAYEIAKQMKAGEDAMIAEMKVSPGVPEA